VEIIERWQGDAAALRPGRAVLIGFPQDEGVRRNRGRPGAAAAPAEVRRWLGRLTPWDVESDVDLAQNPPLDAGDIAIHGSLEETQAALAEVVAGFLDAGMVPILLGGGHETTFGHYLGYVAAARPVGIVNLDAHLDVRPLIAGQGHSGSPFRQAMEHPAQPLPGERYVCLGAQPHATSRAHWQYVQQRGSIVHWREGLQPAVAPHLARELERLAELGCKVLVTLDVDVVQMADVPGVSAPNSAGLPGREVLAAVRLAGQAAVVSSFDLVEINPRLDRDGQSARWGGLAIWNFLIGLATRSGV
jgi:formiminoglutamase